MKQLMSSRCHRCNQYFSYERVGVHSRARQSCDICKPLVLREKARERKRKERERKQSTSLANQSVTTRRKVKHGTERYIIVEKVEKPNYWSELSKRAWSKL